AASFNLPWGITSDNVNHVAYVSDSINNRIRTINLLTNNVSTLATVSSPRGIVYHASGVLYITGASIQKVVVATGAVSTIAAQSAIYWFLCVNSAGTLLSTLLYATVGNTVVRVNTNGSGAVITLVAGTTTAGFVDGGGTDTYFNTPLGIALNDEESTLFIADSNNYRIGKAPSHRWRCYVHRSPHPSRQDVAALSGLLLQPARSAPSSFHRGGGIAAANDKTTSS
ncbi:Hypothetical protein, putative, partial [Bodo saltans]